MVFLRPVFRHFWRPVKGGLTNLVQALTAPPIANKCSHQGPEWKTFSEKGDDGDDDGGDGDGDDDVKIWESVQ